MNVLAGPETCQNVLSEIRTAVIGEQHLFETILTAVVGQGHVLLEDVPGTGKTDGIDSRDGAGSGVLPDPVYARLAAGRDYVAPEDVHAIVHPVLDHRIVLTTEADVRDVDPRTIVDGALNSVPVPSMDS